MCEITRLLNINGLFILAAEMWKYYESHFYSQILACPRPSQILTAQIMEYKVEIPSEN